MKRTLIIIIVVTVIFVISSCTKQERSISGYVIDCQTNQPVPNVEVTLFNRAITSQSIETPFENSTLTDDAGYFRLSLSKGDSARIHAKKERYYTAEQWEYFGKEVRVNILPGDPNELSYNCKLASECIKDITTKEGRVVTRNICNSPL